MKLPELKATVLQAGDGTRVLVLDCPRCRTHKLHVPIGAQTPHDPMNVWALTGTWPNVTLAPGLVLPCCRATIVKGEVATATV